MPALTIDPPVATPQQPKGKGAVPDAVKRAVEAKVYGYFYSFVEMGVVKTFIDHQIFQANVNILERFCNYLIASDVLSQGSAPRRVAHGRTSRFFLDEGVALMFSHLFENCLLPVAHWPEYFETNGLAEPRQANVTPWGLSWGYPDKTNYEVFAMFPEKALPFNASMKVGVQDMPITGMYDFGWIGEYAAASSSSSPGDRERTLFVDVGGGMGQALKAILAENQDIPAWRCALQDRPETIVEVKKEADPALAQVQKFGASFHGEEPVKGALVYHIRRVLNDWPDDDVVNIFGQIRAACAPDSRVLVSEQLVPDGPSLMMGALDLFMMNFGGKRRNERQYGELAERAGFRVSSVSRHESSDSAVIELVVA
ncbi:Demethylsterigmatocystin 6-O-methyltransferase [Cytospora mali]|uniref:Demethylsterigmatocystin 6-O-methyltransferase n=1 Tax=Cytospora mali TaxID=578113 RepID=A0A194VVI4_CYTMA|nr:Demethylsterigmatocystin 6-O-methyltransferase [Valsa mali]